MMAGFPSDRDNFKVRVSKNCYGKFGFEFGLDYSGAIINRVDISCISDRPLQVGDKIKAINGTRDIRAVVAQAARDTEWILDIERYVDPESMTLVSHLDSMSYPSEVQRQALKAPEKMNWTKQSISYDDSSVLTVKALKKKFSRDRQIGWLLVEDLEHVTSYSNLNRLQKADWIVTFNLKKLDFHQPREMLLEQFRDLSRRRRPVSFGIFRPSLQEVGRQSVPEGLRSEEIVRPKIPEMSVQDHNLLPRSLVGPGCSNDLYLHPSPSVSTIDFGPSSSMADVHQASSSPNLEPDALMSLRKLSYKRIGKLCYYRIFVHDVGQIFDSLVTLEHFLQRLFGLPKMPMMKDLGLIKQVHLHVKFQENPNDFQILNMSNEGNGAWLPELFDTIGEFVRYRRYSGSDNSIHPSLQEYNRFNSNTEHQLHVEVIALKYLENYKWYAPVLFCNYSINLILIDNHKDLPNVATLLHEIMVHSKGVSDHVYEKKVFLVSKTMSGLDDIEMNLRPFLPMFVRCRNERLWFPYDDINPGELRDSLMNHLHHHSEADLTNSTYPHAVVLLWQTLQQRKLTRIIESNVIKEIIDEIISLHSDSSTEDVVWKALNYLHNAGLAYVPDCAYAHRVGFNCPQMAHTIFLRPYQFVVTARTLTTGYGVGIDRAQLDIFRSNGETTEKLLNKLLNDHQCEKLACLLKELKIVFPNPYDKSILLIPSVIRTSSPPRDLQKPDLLLRFSDIQPFLLNVCLFTTLASRSVTSDVNYQISFGTFDLFGWTVTVAHTVLTEYSRQIPTSESSRSMSLYLEQSHSNTPPSKFVEEMKELVNSLPFRLDITFGPVCGLDTCRSLRTKGELHVLDLLSGPPFSCGGRRLDDAVKLYVSDPSNKGKDSRKRTREQLLKWTADRIPKEAVLRYNASVNSDWIRLASYMNFDDDTIRDLKESSYPVYELLVRIGRNGITLDKLVTCLSEIGFIALIDCINSWLDDNVSHVVDNNS